MSRSSLDGIANYQFSEVEGFDPRDIDDLLCWYDADALEGFSDGDPVDTWDDESGNDIDITASSGDRPTYETDVQNGLPGVYFDNSNRIDDTDGFAQGTQSQPNTIFVVHSIDNGSSRCFVFDGNGADDDTTKRHALIVNDDPDDISLWSDSYVHYENYGTPYGPIIATCLFDSPDTTLWVDGDEKASGDSGNHDFDEICVGERRQGGDNHDGHIFELLAYGRDLTTEEREDVEDYLSDKWDITLNR